MQTNKEATLARMLRKKGLTNMEVTATLETLRDIDAQRRARRSSDTNFDMLIEPLLKHIRMTAAHISTTSKRAPHRAETLRQYLMVLRKTRDHIKECRMRHSPDTPVREVLRACHPNPETWPAPHNGAIWTDWVSPKAVEYIMARVHNDNTLHPPQRQGFRPFRAKRVNVALERRWDVLATKIVQLKREHTLAMIAKYNSSALDLPDTPTSKYLPNLSARMHVTEAVLMRALKAHENGAGLKLTPYEERVFVVLDDALRRLGQRADGQHAPFFWTQLLSVPDSEFARNWEDARLAPAPRAPAGVMHAQEIPS